MSWPRIRRFPEQVERNAAIVLARKNGETYKLIGERFHITAGRAEQICKRQALRDQYRRET